MRNCTKLFGTDRTSCWHEALIQQATNVGDFIVRSEGILCCRWKFRRSAPEVRRVCMVYSGARLLWGGVDLRCGGQRVVWPRRINALVLDDDGDIHAIGGKWNQQMLGLEGARRKRLFIGLRHTIMQYARIVQETRQALALLHRPLWSTKSVTGLIMGALPQETSLCIALCLSAPVCLPVFSTLAAALRT